MQTNTRLSPLEAAKATGRGKATITAALRKGKISGERDPDTGQWHIEPVELFRVFPPITEPTEPAMKSGDEPHQAGSKPGKKEAQETGSQASLQVERLKMELSAIRREVETQREERERERRQLEETNTDLRQRLDKSEEERRRKDLQLTALLTDQREKAETPQRSETNQGFLGLFRRVSA